MGIKEIITDPRYRQFAKECCACGRQVVPDGYPWKWMGVTDEEFLRQPHRFQDDDSLMSANMKVRQLGVLRAQERLVVQYWDWWIARQEPEPGTREAAVMEICGPGSQMTLF